MKNMLAVAEKNVNADFFLDGFVAEVGQSEHIRVRVGASA